LFTFPPLAGKSASLVFPIGNHYGISESNPGGIDLSQSSRPFAYDSVFTSDHPAGSSGAANAPAGEFDSPDNLALDRKGSLAITEDPSTNTVAADVWIAPRPGDRRVAARQPPACRGGHHRRPAHQHHPTD
jgi:hypothetical protein